MSQSLRDRLVRNFNDIDLKAAEDRALYAGGRFVNAELVRGAGSRFDPHVVHQLC